MTIILISKSINAVNFAFVVSKYRVRFSNSSKALRTWRPDVSMTNITIDLPEPKSAYSQESRVIDIPTLISGTNETVWIGITAVDENDLESNISNLVSSRYMYMPVSVSMNPNKCLPGTIIKCLSDLYFYIIVGGSALLVFLFLLLILFCCLRKRRRPTGDETKLHDGDSSTISSPASDRDTTSDFYSEFSGMAGQDEIQMTAEHTSTYRRKPLPSTKKRIQSFKFQMSLKRADFKSSKTPAPAPPSNMNQSVKQTAVSKDVEQNSSMISQMEKVWVDSKTKKTVVSKTPAQTVSSNMKSLHFDRSEPKPEHVDVSTIPSDLEAAEGYCSNFIQAEKEKSSVTNKACNPDEDVRL